MRSPLRTRGAVGPRGERYCSGADRAVKAPDARSRSAFPGISEHRSGDSPVETRGFYPYRDSTVEEVGMFTRWAVAAVVAALVLGPGHSAAGLSVPPNGYTIGTEDILDITVWNNTVISRTVPVRPDGMISLPLLDDVQAAGLTPKQLKADLTRRLAKYIASPEVSVVVREIHSLKVAVIGEVRRPGRYDMKSRTSILEA